nr:site-specific integrase [Microlunatus panaciterrae]
MAGQGHLKPSTAYRYQGIVKQHIVTYWGSWTLASVNHSDVATWLAGLSAAGLRPGSVRQIHRVFAMIMNAAVVDGRIGRSPAEGVKLPRQVRSEPRSLTSDEVGRLAAAAGPENAPLILVLAFTGLRFGEAAGLRVRRVDFARRRLDIREVASEVGGRVVFGTPKTHQRRTVVVPRSLMPLLEAACAGKAPDDHVFTSPDGSVLRLRNWRSRVFDPARAAAGLDHARPHDLRHTAASLAIASGATVKAVQSMLGHASAAMTLDIYASLFADELDAVADAMDAAVPQMCHIATSATSGPHHSDDEK